MLKKEFQDTMRILLESSLFMFAIPVVLLVALIFDLEAPSADLTIAVCFITIFIYAIYSGMALFLREKRDNSLEYMLTLPVSRLKLLAVKMAPRLLVLASLAGLIAIFSHVTFYGFILPLLYFHLGMVFLSLALTRSYFAGFIAAIMMAFVYTMGKQVMYASLYLLGGKTFKFTGYINPSLLTVLIVLIPLAISFIMVFKKLDLRPYRFSVRPYFYVALPVIGLEIIYMLFTYDYFRYWY